MATTKKNAEIQQRKIVTQIEENRRIAADISPKQKRWADLYIISGNATKAAIEAGYKASNARGTGYELRTNPHVAAYLRMLVDEQSQDVVASRDEVLRHLSTVARGLAKEETIITVYEDGKAKLKHATKKVSIKDQLVALNRLLDLHTGNGNEIVSVSGNVTTTSLIAELRKRRVEVAIPAGATIKGSDPVDEEGGSVNDSQKDRGTGDTK